MTEPLAAIKQHYGTPGIAERILATLAAEGADVERLTAEMLYPYDQFHGRQLAATREHLGRLGLVAGEHVLDVGCGIGGPARFMAASFGVRVTGIDLTEEFIAAATELTRRVGLDRTVDFRQGNALEMPFADGGFDVAACQYVAMNIADKAGLAREIRRVLKPGGRLMWSQVVAGPGGPPLYPLPWAGHAGVSFIVPAEALAAMIEGAGFRLTEWTDETDLFLAARRPETAPAPLPQGARNRVALGEQFSERARNLERCFGEDRLRAVIARAEAV